MVNLNEQGYLNLLKDTYENGIKKETRNGYTYSIFGALLRFNLENDIFFPLITTKKIFFKGVIEELLWMFRGSVSSKELEEKGVNIWKGNSSREYLDSVGLVDYEEGNLGPIYGYQWRKFNGIIDQIKYLLFELSLKNSRRALISAWNPCQLKDQALPPCHLIYNFYKNDDNTLSCMMYMRSSDLFLGLPFNIASTAAFATIIATVMGMKVKDVCISICDCHIYEEHVSQVEEQLTRNCFKFPSLIIKNNVDNIKDLPINKKIEWIENLKFEDFILTDYECHSSLKAPMK